MQTTRAIREKAAQLLAADTATLAAANPAEPIMALVKAPFVATENTVVGDLTLADFDGSTPLAIDDGTQPEGLDPNNADALISISPPAGGFRWETTGVTNLPQTIYGYALLKSDSTVLYAAKLLPAPIELTAVNQVVDIGAPTIRQLAGSMT